MSSKTEKKIRMALYRITKGRSKVVKGSRKLSIAAVAEEADVSPSLIHNQYPQICEEIRTLLGKTYKARSDARCNEIRRLKSRNSELLNEIKEYKVMLSNLASRNVTLTKQLELLDAGLRSEKIDFLSRYRDKKK